MKSDIEIARSIELKKIKQVAESVGIPREEVENYGRYIAKIPEHLIDEEKVKQSNLILVTAITATKAGIGKTTVSIGLALGLNKIGKKAIVALREPSLGPCFGMKGGAAGGGNVETGLQGNPVGTWSKSGNNAAQGAVVHIEHTPPDNFFQAESVRLMLVDIVIQQSGNHIVSGSNGMEISCEM